MTNRYAGNCHACRRSVAPGEGELEPTGLRRRGKRYKLWCLPCYNASDDSGPDDRVCGNRAYEDACARAVGY